MNRKMLVLVLAALLFLAQPALARSSSARGTFLRSQGYTHTPRGYVVDHIVPLAVGGRDAPSNMQLQTRRAARAKDLIECNGHKCGGTVRILFQIEQGR